MNPEPEQESIHLLRQMAGGDQEAFGQFYDLYAPLVFSFALRMLRVRSEAEDLVQEVFLQAWRQAARYNKALGSPEAWLTTITRSRGVDRLRYMRRREQGSLPIEYSRVQESVENERSVDLTDQSVVRGALAELPEAQRTVIELAYFDGLTQSEIADHLKQPLGTVKTRIRAGIARLRDLMGIGRFGDRP